MNFSPFTPWGFLAMELRRRIDRARSEEADLGASTIEWVIITGVLVVLAAAVGLAIYNMVKTEADSLQMPAAPGGP
jgi:hypothetical protein